MTSATDMNDRLRSPLRRQTGVDPVASARRRTRSSASGAIGMQQVFRDALPKRR